MSYGGEREARRLRAVHTPERCGRKYPAFWTCPVQLDDGTYCKKRPLVAWEKTHPAERAA